MKIVSVVFMFALPVKLDKVGQIQILDAIFIKKEKCCVFENSAKSFASFNNRFKQLTNLFLYLNGKPIRPLLTFQSYF